MPKAVIRNGAIVPLEPLPPEWGDGTEVSVETVSAEEARAIEQAFVELDRLCAAEDDADYELIQKTIAEADREAKAWVRREMGLPE